MAAILALNAMFVTTRIFQPRLHCEAPSAIGHGAATNCDYLLAWPATIKTNRIGAQPMVAEQIDQP
jgi:hypothetical protein